MAIGKVGPIRIADASGAVRELIDSIGADRSISSEDYILPGFTDVHVHLREPGFSYKETIGTGTLAAAAGGFTNIITMPNLDPVPDCAENLKIQTNLIKRDAHMGVHPLASITRGEKGRELSDIEDLAPLTSGFSDDGVGVMDEGLMREAMIRIKAADSIVVAHCEDTNWPRESRQAEWKQLERDIRLADETGCPYHMCHASTAESVQIIRDGKKSGVDVTAETAPHYLILTDRDVTDDGRFKMNPPIKSEKDKNALIEAVIDGTIDMIATDHAPHSAEEKAGGFQDSLYGIVGLETAFPVIYTELFATGAISWDRLMELMSASPERRFKLKCSDPDRTFTVWDLDSPYRIDAGDFLSKGKSSPFVGRTVYGRCKLTVVDGRAVYQRQERK